MRLSRMLLASFEHMKLTIELNATTSSDQNWVYWDCISWRGRFFLICRIDRPDMSHGHMAHIQRNIDYKTLFGMNYCCHIWSKNSIKKLSCSAYPCHRVWASCLCVWPLVFPSQLLTTLWVKAHKSKRTSEVINVSSGRRGITILTWFAGTNFQ